MRRGAHPGGKSEAQTLTARILRLFRFNGELGASDLMEIFGLSRDAAAQHLSRLHRKGLLSRTGTKHITGLYVSKESQ